MELDARLAAVARPDLILVGSMMTYWYPGVVETIVYLKQAFPGVPVVLGGVYATLCPEHARRVSGADMVVPGPAEQNLGSCLRQYVPTARIPHGAPWLEPAYDLLQDRSVLPLLTSRGCPFRCHYCASAQLYPGFVRSPWQRVATQLDQWCDRAEMPTDIAVYDDALLIDAQQFVIPLLQHLVRKNLRIRLHAPNGLHARFITPHLAELLYAAGFRTIRLGLETVDPALQHSTGNKVNCAEFEQAASALRAAGFTSRQVGAYILAGLPGQQHESVRDALHFSADCGIRPVIAEYSPIPGTRMWPQAVVVSPFPIAREPLFHNNTLLPCRSSSFSLDDLARLKQESHRLAAQIESYPHPR